MVKVYNTIKEYINTYHLRSKIVVTRCSQWLGAWVGSELYNCRPINLANVMIASAYLNKTTIYINIAHIALIKSSYQ